MILFINPRSTRPKNRRFPLSLMAVGAALPPSVSWEILDENLLQMDVGNSAMRIVTERDGSDDPVEMFALTVMPGPQLVSAVRLSKLLRSQHPDIPIVWGGNFGSLYPGPVLNAPYVDWLVRGQGEQTFLELLDVLRGCRDPRDVAGLAFQDSDGGHHIGKERTWVGPDDLPAPPYHKIEVREYLHPTVLGTKSGVYQASIGCPFSCNFCGVISVFGRKENVQNPTRTAQHLMWLKQNHGMDSVHFYDNNFFLNDDHAREVADAFQPLGLRWWCEARVDTLCRFSDDTWRRLKSAGLTMVFCGAESGSDAVLAKMQKGITTEQIELAAARCRAHGIIPEFSFVFGDPDEPEREIDNTLRFIRKLKRINPQLEIISYFYTPTPQRAGTYGDIDPLSGTPGDLDEWIKPEWVNWMTHEDPLVPWLSSAAKAKVDNFGIVLKSRFPSAHDRLTRPWGKLAGRLLSMRRWQAGCFDDPRLLRLVRDAAQRAPEDRQAYGHLRQGATE